MRSRICFYHLRYYLLSFPVNLFCSRQPWSDFYHHRWGSYHGSWPSYNWSIEYIFFCVWLPSLNIMFVRCIHIDDLSVVCSFLLLNSIPFLVDAHLNYFKFLMTKNKASMYSLVKVFFFLFVDIVICHVCWRWITSPLSKNIFIFNVKDLFTGYRIQGWHMLFYCLVAFTVSDQMSDSFLISFPWMCYISLICLLIWFYIFSIQHFDSDMSRFHFLCILLGVCWTSWIHGLIPLINFGKLVNIFSSSISFTPTSHLLSF